jgi:dihydroorotate dehydrogenase
MDYYKLARPFLFRLPPEKAHNMVIEGIKQGLIPLPKHNVYNSLITETLDMKFSNPLGLAAGFDKNAEVYNDLLAAGFGFAEVGTITPKPQAGNPQPRIFRLREDEAIINRLGFNNKGMEAVANNIPVGTRLNGILGINIGKNKDTAHAAEDYTALITTLYTRADYITINISSPNTAGLRDLQKRENLEELIKQIMSERNAQAALANYKVPLLVKIAPDVSPAELEDIVGIALENNVDGLIVSNTTISRPSSLRSEHKTQQGGLSGKPLMDLSTNTLKRTFELSRGKIPLIGVGGVSSAEDVITKMRSGATLVQLYSALVYNGFWLIERIKKDLAEFCDREGIDSLQEIVGVWN